MPTPDGPSPPGGPFPAGGPGAPIGPFTPHDDGPTQAFPGQWGYGQGYRGPRVRDAQVVKAFVCGLCSLLLCGFVLGPIGLSMGIQSLQRINRSDGLVKGRGLAIAAVVLGAFGSLAGVLQLILMITNPEWVGLESTAGY